MSLTASEFNLPAGLQQVDQKEYLGGEQGGAMIEAKPAKFARTACLSTLTEAQLGTPLYPKATAARSQPYNAADHNTQWYYKAKDDYRVRFATADPFEKVVAFYEAKLKTKCAVTTRPEGGATLREAVCTQPAGGTVRTFTMTDQPIEITSALEIGTLSAEETDLEKRLAFELAAAKAPSKK
jgi:hypothetical protein